MVNEMRKWVRLVESVSGAGAAAIVTWAETVGVYATVHETPDGLVLLDIERDKTAPKGVGATFIEKLCAYADHRRLPIYAGVTGGNVTLEDYYKKFGFKVIEDTRDEETSDVDIERQPQV